jgi:hypothetical protein
MRAGCPHCGGPNPPGATLCRWCGALLVPLRIARNARRIDLHAAFHPGDAPPRRTSRAWMIWAIAFVVIMLVILAAAGTWIKPQVVTTSWTPTMDITGVNVSSPDDACGLDGDTSGTVTLHQHAGVEHPVISWAIPGPSGSLPCAVSSAGTNTTGFEVFGNLPMNFTSAGLLNLSLVTPLSFQGIVNVTLL